MKIVINVIHIMYVQIVKMGLYWLTTNFVGNVLKSVQNAHSLEMFLNVLVVLWDFIYLMANVFNVVGIAKYVIHKDALNA